MAYGLLLVRVVLGLTMAGHGAQKLFGWWDGPGLHGVHGWLASLRFRGGWAPVALLVAAELGGGLGLALGLATPLAALAVVAAMLVAIATAHLPKGFWNTGGGYEFNLLIVAAAAALAATGAGRFSLDELAGWEGSISGLWWAVGVLVAAGLAAAAVLTLGRRPAPQAAAADERRTLRAA